MDNNEELRDQEGNIIDEDEDKGGLIDLAEEYGEIIMNIFKSFAEEDEEEKIRKMKE